jgi:hypothetical protein
MSADGGHLGWQFGSLDIILKVDHLRTIHAMFALNWLTGFRGNFFWHEWSLSGKCSKLCPVTLTSIQDGLLQWTYCSFNIGPYGKKCFKIFSSADGCHLGWRSGSQDIILKVDHLRTIHPMFALN